MGSDDLITGVPYVGVVEYVEITKNIEFARQKAKKKIAVIVTDRARTI